MDVTLARRKSSLAKGKGTLSQAVEPLIQGSTGAAGRRRSSMGEYIPPVGGRPLSAQCEY